MTQFHVWYAGGVVSLVGSSLKPELGLSGADDDCFSAAATAVDARARHVTRAPAALDLHRAAANADSSTCLHSRYTTANELNE